MTAQYNSYIDDHGEHRAQRAPADEMLWPWMSDVHRQISQALLTATTFDHVLQAGLPIIVPTNAAGVTILLSSGPPDDGHLYVVAAWVKNGQPSLPVNMRFSSREALFEGLRTTGQCTVVNDLASDERVSENLRSALLQTNRRAAVALPFGSGQDFFGALLVDRSDNTTFEAESVQVYEAWVDLAEGALHRLWLIREKEQALDRALALYEISHRILECKSINDILQVVIDSDLFGAAGGTIALLEPTAVESSRGAQDLVFWTAAGAGSERIQGMRMPVSEGVVGWVVREDEPALVPDAYADERFYSQIDQDIEFHTQSILCAPLRVEGQVIGAIELVDVREEYLSEEGVRLLSQVADQAALFIHNQRLLGETQRQARELSLLLDVSHDLSSVLEREEALHLISSRVLDLVKADGCHIFLSQTAPDGEELLIPVASSHRYYAEQILNTPLKYGQGITGRVAQSGTGIIANRVDLDPRGFPVPGTPRDPENLISVPLISQGRMIGVMTVSRAGEEEFIANDLRMISAIASQAATMLEKARLFEETQQRSQELAALNAVTSTASQSLSHEEILNATLERITQVLPGSAGLISLRNPLTGELEQSTQRHLPEPVVRHIQQNGMRNTLCAITVQNNVTNSIPDLSAGTSHSVDLRGVDTASLVTSGLRSYLGTPLVAHGQILGTLSVFSAEPNAFGPAEADLLTAIGQQVGIAIRNAQLYEQTERALAESTALYEASQAISNTLDLDDVLQITINRMAEHVRADQGRVILFEKPMGYGRVIAEYHPTPGIENLRIPMEGNLAYEALSDRGQALYIEDVRSDPITASNTRLPIDDDVVSALFLPLTIQGRLIGMISLSSEIPRAFTESETTFCQTLADRAALAAENRRLFSQTFYSLQETTLLYQASRALTQAKDLQDVLHAITDNLPIKQIDQCWIALLDPDRDDDADPAHYLIEIEAIWDHEGDHSLLERRLTARELPILSQPSAARSLVVNDMGNASDFDTRSVATLQALGVKSALIVPLLAGNRPLGWLFLITHHHTHIFDPDQIRPYEALADQAAVVIRNQQLLQEVQDSLKEIETVHRQYLRSEWTAFLQSREDQLTAVAYDHGTLLPAQHLSHPLLEEAFDKGAPVTRLVNDPAVLGINQVAESKDDEGRTHSPVERQARTSLVMPLKVRGQVIGALGLEDPENSHDWTADEMSMIQEIADRVAQAVENARLLDETQSSLAETERLYHATSRLSNAENAFEVLRVLAEEIESALGPGFCGSILSAGPDPAGRINWLEASARWNAGDTAIPLGTRFSISGHPAFVRFLGQSGPILIKDTDTLPQGASPWEHLTQSHPATMLAIPLVVGSSWLGMINIASQEKSTPEARTMRFLQNLADRAAVALESVRLYGVTQRRAIQLEAAAKVSRAATSILDQEKLLSSVVELIRDHFGYYHAQVFLLDPTENWALLEASTAVIGDGLHTRKNAMEVGGNSLIGQVTSTGEPRNAYDVTKDAFHAIDPDLPDTRSELAIPIKIGGRVIGALDVQSTELAAFGPDDIAVLSLLADQLAIAIENAQLYQDQLATAEKLREVDRLKTQFLANMSHELRTPLNSIIGFSRVILKGIDGPVTDLQKQDLSAIYTSGQLLLKLINDILDISKINAGKMELAFEETYLNEIINGVMTTAGALVKDRPEIRLRQNVPTDLPLIIADGTRLRQVLLNMLSNAVKFTARGDVELSVTHDDRFVTIQVRDTGIGIPADKFDLIFQEFEQVDGSTTRSAGGTGLGLPISRHFVRLHGGRMWVDSKVGVGSTFFVRLPIEGPQSVEHLDEEPGVAANHRLILAIDDDVDAIRLYKRHLEKHNYQVIGLSESEFAIKKALELRPQAILLDLLMPGKDGWAVVEDLKLNPKTQDIPIIICSIVSDEGCGFSLGAADYLVKPIAEDRLLETLSRLENGFGRKPSEMRRVLIIDDTPEDRKFLRRVIESANECYQVTEAGGGVEGVNVIQQDKPDLVILDLLMPGMDGFSVLESLKVDKRTRQIPIIIVTAKELTDQERTQINGKVAALFRKGLFKEDELVQDLHYALHRARKPKE